MSAPGAGPLSFRKRCLSAETIRVVLLALKRVWGYIDGAFLPSRVRSRLRRPHYDELNPLSGFTERAPRFRRAPHVLS